MTIIRANNPNLYKAGVTITGRKTIVGRKKKRKKKKKSCKTIQPLFYRQPATLCDK